MDLTLSIGEKKDDDLELNLGSPSDKLTALSQAESEIGQKEKKQSAPWGPEEDALIRELVMSVGQKKWSHIAARVS